MESQMKFGIGNSNVRRAVGVFWCVLMALTCVFSSLSVSANDDNNLALRLQLETDDGPLWLGSALALGTVGPVLTLKHVISEHLAECSAIDGDTASLSTVRLVYSGIPIPVRCYHEFSGAHLEDFRTSEEKSQYPFELISLGIEDGNLKGVDFPHVNSLAVPAEINGGAVSLGWPITNAASGKADRPQRITVQNCETVDGFPITFCQGGNLVKPGMSGGPLVGRQDSSTLLGLNAFIYNPENIREFTSSDALRELYLDVFRQYGNEYLIEQVADRNGIALAAVQPIPDALIHFFNADPSVRDYYSDRVFVVIDSVFGDKTNPCHKSHGGALWGNRKFAPAPLGIMLLASATSLKSDQTRITKLLECNAVWRDGVSSSNDKFSTLAFESMVSRICDVHGRSAHADVAFRACRKDYAMQLIDQYAAQVSEHKNLASFARKKRTYNQAIGLILVDLAWRFADRILSESGANIFRTVDADERDFLRNLTFLAVAEQHWLRTSTLNNGFLTWASGSVGNASAPFTVAAAGWEPIEHDGMKYQMPQFWEIAQIEAGLAEEQSDYDRQIAIYHFAAKVAAKKKQNKAKVQMMANCAYIATLQNLDASVCSSTKHLEENLCGYDSTCEERIRSFISDT